MFYFPFGQPLKRVAQIDRTPNKKVFVLGVYASAVHARWIGSNGKELIKALAVASEPDIFWKGENADSIISNIKLPTELGRLLPPTDKALNGPSGNALDTLFLKPLGLERKDSWLCDLLPESRVNPQQRKAIDKYYTTEILERFNLCPATIPDFNKDELRRSSPLRHLEILAELKESKADTLILLGDLPIRWFLNFFEKKFSRLSDFGETNDSYGRIHEMRIDGGIYNVIPLCHPRNASRLGAFSDKWAKFHDKWQPEAI